jgi:PilZ domain
MPESQSISIPETNRRVDPRYPADAVRGITGTRLSPGDTVTLVNISASGALVEGKTRFVPGTQVTLHFEGTFTPNQVKGRVVRCQVSAIGGGGSLLYHSALSFQTRLELHGEALSSASSSGGAAPDELPVSRKGSVKTVGPAAACNQW